jgi:hypothetical protein
MTFVAFLLGEWNNGATIDFRELSRGRHANIQFRQHNDERIQMIGSQLM